MNICLAVIHPYLNGAIRALFTVFIVGLWLTIVGTAFTCLIMITKRLGKIADCQQQIADAVNAIADKNTIIK